MLREQGYGDVAVAYSDSTADLPLLMAAKGTRGGESQAQA